MKTQALVVAALAIMLASCASPIQRRVEHNPQLFAKLSDNDKHLVQTGQVREGMTKEAVFLAWGTPARTSAGKRDGKPYERWHYLDYQPVFVDGYAAGFGIGYWGHRHSFAYYDPFYYPAPSVEYVPTGGRFVDFVSGRVTSYLMPR